MWSWSKENLNHIKKLVAEVKVLPFFRFHFLFSHGVEPAETNVNA
jgi:hypothetical protein